MNAQIAPHIRGARREDYEPNVRAFLPSCEGDELEIRSALLLMRDLSAAAKPQASEQGWCLLDVVERTASESAFRAMKLDELTELRRLLRQVVAAAAGFDQLYAPALPLGETDDRG